MHTMCGQSCQCKGGGRHCRNTPATKKSGTSLQGLSNLRQSLNHVPSRYTFMTNTAIFQIILPRQVHIHLSHSKTAAGRTTTSTTLICESICHHLYYMAMARPK